MSLPLNVFWCRAQVFAAFFFQFLQILAIYDFFSAPVQLNIYKRHIPQVTYVNHIHDALKHQYHRPLGSGVDSERLVLFLSWWKPA